MVHLRTTFAFVKLLSVAQALATSDFILHEKRIPHTHWKRLDRLPYDMTLPMKIGLAHSNIYKLDELLDAVSHPNSSHYGQHYSVEDLASTFGSSQESILTVQDWLVGNGIPLDRINLSTTKSWVYLNITVAEAEALLSTEYHIYNHPSGSAALGLSQFILIWLHPNHASKDATLIISLQV